MIIIINRVKQNSKMIHHYSVVRLINISNVKPIFIVMFCQLMLRLAEKRFAINMSKILSLDGLKITIKSPGYNIVLIRVEMIKCP